MAEEKKVRTAGQAVEDSMNTRQALKGLEASCGAKGNLSQLVDKVNALDVVTLNEKVRAGSYIVCEFIDVFMVVFFWLHIIVHTFIWLFLFVIRILLNNFFLDFLNFFKIYFIVYSYFIVFLCLLVFMCVTLTYMG